MCIYMCICYIHARIQILLHHERIEHLHEQPGSPAGLRGQTLQQRWLMRQGNTLMPRVEQGAAWCDVT